MGKRAQNYRAWRYQNPNGTPEQAWNAAWDSHSANQYSRTMQRLGDELNAMTGIANTQKDIIGEQQAEIERLKKPLTHTAARLAAAISLLERGGKAAKKAAPSDKMFDQMLLDYKKALSDARAALAATEPKG